MLSYKRNRGVRLLVTEDKNVRITEWGYHEQDVTVRLDDFLKKLKAIFKTEFPRSRKVRVYQVGAGDYPGRERKQL